MAVSAPAFKADSISAGALQRILLTTRIFFGLEQLPGSRPATTRASARHLQAGGVGRGR